MNFEGMALVYKKGVYRINLGYDVCRIKLGIPKENCTDPTKKIADNIQNLKIKSKVKAFSSLTGTKYRDFTIR